MKELTSQRRRAEMHSRWMEKLYSSYSDYYDLFFDKILKPGREEGVKALTIENGDRVLEVGIGTGLSIPFYPEYCSVTGIDISADMLKKARDKVNGQKNADIVLKKMDASHLAFKDESFNKILVPYLISVVPEPKKVIAEMNRVCMQEGIVVFVNHFHSSNHFLAFLEKIFSPVSRYMGFRLDLPIETVLEDDFFQIERIEKVNLFGLWSMIKLKKRRYQ